MEDRLPHHEMEDRIDVWGKGAIIAKAAKEQLFRQRGARVDRYAEPPRPPSMTP